MFPTRILEDKPNCFYSDFRFSCSYIDEMPKFFFANKKIRIFSNLIRTSFCRFLKRKKKLVRGSNLHISFNRPLPARQTDGIILDVNTFTAIVDLSRFNNSCLKSPASTLVDLTFQSRALRSFSLNLNQLRNLSL